jgi:hypothetical protein
VRELIFTCQTSTTVKKFASFYSDFWIFCISRQITIGCIKIYSIEEDTTLKIQKDLDLIWIWFEGQNSIHWFLCRLFCYDVLERTRNYSSNITYAHPTLRNIALLMVLNHKAELAMGRLSDILNRVMMNLCQWIQTRLLKFTMSPSSKSCQSSKLLP